MKVILPWAHRHPEVLDALAVAHPGFASYFVGSDVRAYGRLIQRLWCEGEPFIIVEHDIVVRPDTIDELTFCYEGWCSFPYMQTDRGDPVTGMGCVKFRASVIRDFEAPRRWDPVPVWQNVDVNLTGVMHAAGIREHVHGPPLRHLNPRTVPRPRTGSPPTPSPSGAAGR